MYNKYINHWLIIVIAWIIGIISYLINDQQTNSLICLFGLCYSFRQWENSTSNFK